MKISIIGAGYVGLTTAACFAHIGHEVFCSESDIEKLAKLQAGVVPIYEANIDLLLRDAIGSGRLSFGSTDEAIDRSEVIFICVGTPPLPNGDADLSCIEMLARNIAKRAKGYRLVVEKSTVPVQTGAQLRKHLTIHATEDFECDVASNPEFLREGSAVEDFLHPDRVVVGVDSDRAVALLAEIYAPIIEGTFDCPVHKNCQKGAQGRFLITDTNSSELIKHASNSFLALKISFINMVANLCEAVGADVTQVAKGIGMDRRIGASFLNPGLGFGGFCFPKDLQAFVRIAEKYGCDFALLKEAEKINKERINHVVQRLQDELWVLRGKKVALLGLAFKPNTDDIRFAPSLFLIQALQDKGVTVSAYDPQATERARAEFPNVNYCADPYEAALGTDAIVLVTEWDEFRSIDWNRIGTAVERKLVIDGRNALDGLKLSEMGFQYVGVGKPSVGGGTPIAKQQMAHGKAFIPRSGTSKQ